MANMLVELDKDGIDIVFLNNKKADAHGVRVGHLYTPSVAFY